MHISDVSGTSLSFTFYAVFLRENIGFQFIFLNTKINPSYINGSVIGCNLHLNVNVISLLTVEALSSGFEKSSILVILQAAFLTALTLMTPDCLL